jgi:hypothetical protein
LKNSHPYFSLFVFLSLSFCACSQDSARTPIALVKQHKHALGTTTLSVNETVYTNSPPIQFIQLHHNELTADEVTRTVSEEIGINYLQIKNGEKRLIDFSINGKMHRFDPNRMFSTEGIVKSLKLHRQYSKEGFTSVSSFRDFLLNFFDRNKTIVAVHNNSDGSFALADYVKNKTGQVHQNILHDPDNFYYD